MIGAWFIISPYYILNFRLYEFVIIGLKKILILNCFQFKIRLYGNFYNADHWYKSMNGEWFIISPYYSLNFRIYEFVIIGLRKILILNCFQFKIRLYGNFKNADHCIKDPMIGSWFLISPYYSLNFRLYEFVIIGLKKIVILNCFQFKIRLYGNFKNADHCIKDHWFSIFQTCKV